MLGTTDPVVSTRDGDRRDESVPVPPGGGTAPPQSDMDGELQAPAPGPATAGVSPSRREDESPRRAPSEGRTIAPAPRGLPGENIPQVDVGSTPVGPRLLPAAQAAGITDERILNAATNGDAAEQALALGVDPVSGQPLTPTDQRSLNLMVQYAEQALSSAVSGAAPGNSEPAPQAGIDTPGAPMVDDGAGGRAAGGLGVQQALAVPSPQGRIVADGPAPSFQPQTPQMGASNEPMVTTATPQAPIIDEFAGRMVQPGPRLSTAPDRGAPQVTGPAPPPQGASGLANAAPPPDPRATPPGSASAATAPRIPAEADAPTIAAVVNPSNPEEQASAVQAAAQAGRELPSVQVGREVADAAAGRQVPGPPGGRITQMLTEQEIAQVGTNFQAAYNAEAAQRLEQFYLQNGRVEEALAWRQFISDENTQTAMYHFGRAQAAASRGDAERFLGEMAALYNSPRYYDDGYTVDLERSEIYRAEDGTFAGVSAAFVNDDTGEVFMQEIANEDQFYEMALGLGAPETVFAGIMERYQASVQERQQAASAWDVLNAPEELRDDFQNIFDQLMDEEADPLRPDHQPFSALPPQEQAQRVVEILQARNAGLTGRSMPAPANGTGAPADVPVAINY